MKYDKDITAEDIYWEYLYDKMDIISTIFNTLGYFHTRKWSQKDEAIQNMLVELVESCLESLKYDHYSSCASGGLKVECWIEEGELFVELFFEI